MYVCARRAPVVGFKAVPSGDVGTNAWSMARSAKVKSLVESGMDQASAKALASGRYTFYQVRLHMLPEPDIWHRLALLLPPRWTVDYSMPLAIFPAAAAVDPGLQDPYALEIGNWTVETEAGTVSGQKVPEGVGGFTKWQDCLNACDDDYL